MNAYEMLLADQAAIIATLKGIEFLNEALKKSIAKPVVTCKLCGKVKGFDYPGLEPIQTRDGKWLCFRCAGEN